jgi:formylmethanofuran dehydrogenase subunit E
MGARMGEHAVTVHKIPKYFGLTVVVECPAEPPGSCIIDGLQAATGATMGKKNIRHVQADEFKVTISQNDTDNKVTYTLKSSTKELLKKWTDEGVDVEESGRRIFKMKAEELFDITP